MRNKDKPKYVLGGVVTISLIFSVVVLGGVGGIGQSSPFLNSATLSFNEQFRDINCQAFNEILLDGRLVVSGEDGFQPLVDSTTLNLQSGSTDVEVITIQLTMECKGNFIKESSSTTVSGDFKMLLCGGSSPTRCIVSDDRAFEQINGVASSTTQFATVPIETQVVPKDNENFTVWKGNISAGFLESVFPEGTHITLVSKMYPNFAFKFNHPSGIIEAKQDSFATNDVVYAQFNNLDNVAPPPPDSDGDGITDGQDSCTGQAEDFNDFEDTDGCPDAFKLLDNDNDGVTNINDLCPEVAGLTDNLGCPEEIETPDPTDDNTGSPTVEFCQTFGQTSCTPTDSDNDGVTNSEDVCPNTSSGAIVDSSGCVLITDDLVVVPTVTDTDGDSILDVFDECPNQVGSLAFNGCPEPVSTGIDNPFANIPDLVNPTTQNPPTTNQPQPTTTGGSIISGFDNSTLMILAIVGVIAVIGIGVVKSKGKL